MTWHRHLSSPCYRPTGSITARVMSVARALAYIQCIIRLGKAQPHPRAENSSCWDGCCTDRSQQGGFYFYSSLQSEPLLHLYVKRFGVKSKKNIRQTQRHPGQESFSDSEGRAAIMKRSSMHLGGTSSVLHSILFAPRSKKKNGYTTKKVCRYGCITRLWCFKNKCTKCRRIISGKKLWVWLTWWST